MADFQTIIREADTDTLGRLAQEPAVVPIWVVVLMRKQIADLQTRVRELEARQAPPRKRR